MPAEWGASGYRDIHWNHIRYAPTTCIALSEDTAGAATVANRDNEFRLRSGVIGALQRSHHVTGDRPRNQQHVRMSRAGDEMDSQAFQVVVGIGQSVNFEFATVAGAGVNMAYRECSIERREDSASQARRGDAQSLVGLRWSFRSDSRPYDEPDRLVHECLACLQVVPAVTQIERLVDERKVGHDISNYRMFQQWPVLPRRIMRMRSTDTTRRIGV